MKRIFIQSNQGIISLSMILLLGAIIIESSLLGLFLVRTLNTTNARVRYSEQAFFSARSGIADGIIQVIEGIDTNSYTISVGTTEVDVVICSVACTGDADRRSITAEGAYIIWKRKLEAIIAVDSITRLTTVESIKEIVQ
jgi:uncharacterized protein (UPF0333 family)